MEKFTISYEKSNMAAASNRSENFVTVASWETYLLKCIHVTEQAEYVY